MTDKRDYYEVLGLGRDCSTGEVRKAYKKLALKFHPDRNDGSAEAEAQFKEVTEAYQVLSDDEKRQRYDQFGHAGVEGIGAGAAGGADIFSHFQDLFSDFFGGMGGGGGFGFGGATRGPARGRDVRIGQQLDLGEAASGCKKEIELHTPQSCAPCGGSGAKPGSKPKVCATCQGRGQVSTGRGFVVFTQACPACHGEGATLDDPCDGCDGAGWVERPRKVTVTFPAGIDRGHRLRVAGQGIPSTSGGPPGHLYVDVDIAPHSMFEREGDDLIARQTISFPEAALGTTVSIQMLDDTTLDVEIGSGVQAGGVITVPRKGLPNVNGHGTGALHIVVQVAVPKRLSRKARKLLEELDAELGTTSSVKTA